MYVQYIQPDILNYHVSDFKRVKTYLIKYHNSKVIDQFLTYIICNVKVMVNIDPH